MRKILKQSFYLRDGEIVVREILGKYLVRKTGNRQTSLMINEVELYEGFEDRSSHGFTRTKRSEIMYGPGGHWYVYLCYGMYDMLNIVLGPKEHPAAILIRGAGEYSGPGRLTKALRIDRQLNAKSAKKESGLWIEDRAAVIAQKDILRTPRIGIGNAGPKWTKRLHRFVLKSRLTEIHSITK
ncbi:MAG TPA: DNA-3-methyladenine glycosylase [Candidatus Paceibacterota bacterium]